MWKLIRTRHLKLAGIIFKSEKVCNASWQNNYVSYRSIIRRRTTTILRETPETVGINYLNIIKCFLVWKRKF